LAEAPPLLPPEAVPEGFVEEEVLLSLEWEEEEVAGMELELGVLTETTDETDEVEVPTGVLVLPPGEVDPPTTEEETPEEVPFKQVAEVEVWTVKGADCEDKPFASRMSKPRLVPPVTVTADQV